MRIGVGTRHRCSKEANSGANGFAPGIQRQFDGRQGGVRRACRALISGQVEVSPVVGRIEFEPTRQRPRSPGKVTALKLTVALQVVDVRIPGIETKGFVIVPYGLGIFSTVERVDRRGQDWEWLSWRLRDC